AKNRATRQQSLENESSAARDAMNWKKKCLEQRLSSASDGVERATFTLKSTKTVGFLAKPMVVNSKRSSKGVVRGRKVFTSLVGSSVSI
ncbi:hypothetical protein PENTCL1PPCAC_25392, partial [Pristionchus entomophagus]